MVEVPPREADLVGPFRGQARRLEEHLLRSPGDGAEAERPGGLGSRPEVRVGPDGTQDRAALRAVLGIRPAIEIAREAVAFGGALREVFLEGVAAGLVMQKSLDLFARGRGTLEGPGQDRGLLGRGLIARLPGPRHGRLDGRAVGRHEGPGDLEHCRRRLGLDFLVADHREGHVEGRRVGHIGQARQEHLPGVGRGGRGPRGRKHLQAHRLVLGNAGQAQVAAHRKDAVRGVVGTFDQRQKIVGGRLVGPVGQGPDGGIADCGVGILHAGGDGLERLRPAETAKQAQDRRLRLGRRGPKRRYRRADSVGHARQPTADRQDGLLGGLGLPLGRNEKRNQFRIIVGLAQDGEGIECRRADRLSGIGRRLQQERRSAGRPPRCHRAEEFRADGRFALGGRSEDTLIHVGAGQPDQAEAGRLLDRALVGGGQSRQPVDG